MDHHNPECVMKCEICKQEFQLHEEYRFDAYTNAYHMSCAAKAQKAKIIGSAHYQGSILLESVYYKGYVTSEPPLYYGRSEEHPQEYYVYEQNQMPDCRNYTCKRHPLYATMKKRMEHKDR
mgnify:FL=1